MDRRGLQEETFCLRTTLDLPLQRMLETAVPGGGRVLMNPASPSLFLAVKEGDVTRGLICVETGEIGKLKVINHLEQLKGPSTKNDIFSFEKLLNRSAGSRCSLIQAPAVSAP